MSGSPSHQIWQRLLSLESQDVVQQRFERIHGRTLNAQRSREINTAARQAREYFHNASTSDYSVRPLLTFYGVACLSRALLLLMKAKGGEESLTQGHGLQTVGWREVMNRSIPEALRKLGELKITTKTGLYSEFLAQTMNITLLHLRSTGVTGHIWYQQPTPGTEIALRDVLARMPDLRADYESVSTPQCAEVDKYSCSTENGIEIKLIWKDAAATAEAYRIRGYAVASVGDGQLIKCDPETALKELPMFVNTYAQKLFGSIHNLYVAVPFSGVVRLSQLGMTYLISYVLGMLVRYYPTHWVALINGGKGDLLWPTVNRAQQYIEIAYPELVADYVDFVLDSSEQLAGLQNR